MWGIENKKIKGLFFKQTCVIAPEQYDVFLDEQMVAYVRCRWGHLTVRPVKHEIEVKDVYTIPDEEYDALELYDVIDWSNLIYENRYENKYKSDIPKKDFDNIADAILEYENRKKTS